jgi:hypothetical protein
MQNTLRQLVGEPVCNKENDLMACHFGFQAPFSNEQLEFSNDKVEEETSDPYKNQWRVFKSNMACRFGYRMLECVTGQFASKCTMTDNGLATCHPDQIYKDGKGNIIQKHRCWAFCERI